MIACGVRFDETAADLDRFAMLLSEFKALLADEKAINRCRRYPGSRVVAYIEERAAGKFTPLDELKPVMEELEKAKTRIADIKASIFRERAAPEGREQKSRPIEGLRDEYKKLLAQSEKAEDTNVVAEAARVRAIEGDFKDDIDLQDFYEFACERLWQMSPHRSRELDALVTGLERWAQYEPPSPAAAEPARAQRIQDLIRSSRLALDHISRGAATSGLASARRALGDHVAQRCRAIQINTDDTMQQLLDVLPAYAQILTLHKAFKLLEGKAVQELLGRTRRDGSAVTFDRMMVLWPLEADSAWARFASLATQFEEPNLAARLNKELSTFPAFHE